MVRKRTRTSKKQYESEEDEDSDLELDLEEVTNTLAPKKYSLRQRKRPLFTEAFDDDFEDAEEIEQLIRKKHSDDEDFEVEKEIVELQEAAKSAPKPHHPHTRKKSSPHKQNTEVTQDTYYEPPPEAESQVEEADGMIDFEDMIRADIVVNKNRIDYDNVICSSEIKVDTPEEDGAKTYPKRACKPRKRYDEEIDSSLLEPELEVEEAEYEDDVNDKDYNPADDLILPSQCLQTEIQESDSNIETAVNGSCSTANGVQSLSKHDAEQTCLAIIDKYTVENTGPSLSEQIVAQTTQIPSIVPEQILENDKPDQDHKETISKATSEAAVLDISKQELDLKPVVSPIMLNGSLPEETQKTVIEEIMIVDDSDDEGDDDDVLIIEPKHEVIVLDD